MNKRWLFFMGSAAIVVFSLIPLLWQLLTSFKTTAQIIQLPNIYWPDPWTWIHYQSLFLRRPLGNYLINSTFIATISTLLALLLGTPCAYGLARLKLKQEQLLLGMLLVVTICPYMLLFLGLLELVRWLGLGNNYLALIVPYTALNLPLVILVLRNYFQQLPPDLEDAARLDGYDTLQLLTRILIPLTAPALVTTGILCFIFAWNEFLFALTFITREDLKTLPVAIAQLGGTSLFEVPYGPIAAATVLGTIPLVFLVVFFQRRIIQGLTAGAVKG